MIAGKNTEKAKKIVAKYTLAATATGAIPVPAASGAIIAENAGMIAQIASTMGEQISVGKVVSSIGAVGIINLTGRSFFIEVGKLLSWGTLNPWGAAALSGVGSATAGIQTYIIVCLAIEIGKNGGMILEHNAAKVITGFAKANYTSFVEHHK
ncbi:MAG: hypothetical protein U9P10_12980 [Thermodesulfobacteriota bacterium]|nr:hypothetical protein [Thermodesulfobacteriota bacterium]